MEGEIYVATVKYLFAEPGGYRGGTGDGNVSITDGRFCCCQSEGGGRLKAGMAVPKDPATDIGCCDCCQWAAGGAGIPVPDAAAIGCCNCCQGAAGGAGIPVPNAPAIGCCVCCKWAAGGAGIPVPDAAVIGCVC